MHTTEQMKDHHCKALYLNTNHKGLYWKWR